MYKFTRKLGVKICTLTYTMFIKVLYDTRALRYYKWRKGIKNENQDEKKGC